MFTPSFVTFIISLLFLITMTQGSTTTLPTNEGTTKPNSSAPPSTSSSSSSSNPENTTKSLYDSRVKVEEFVDGDSLDVYWTPSKEDEPLLRLVIKGTTDLEPGETKLCEEQSMAIPLVNKTRAYASCQVYSYVMVELELALVPTVCNGNNLTNTNNCAVLDNVIPDFHSVKTWEMRVLFRQPATLEAYQHDYKYWMYFNLSDELPTKMHYDLTIICYRLEEFVVGVGRNETDVADWEMIYNGTKTFYILKGINTEGIRKYRVFFRGCPEVDDMMYANEPIVWSKSSNVVEIDFRHGTTPTAVPTTAVPTTTETMAESLAAKRRLTYAIASIILVIVIVVLLIFSYYFCYKHLGLCKRVDGGIPRPKLLIPISSPHDPSAPHSMDAVKSRGDMEEAIDEATPLGRGHLLASEHCMENEVTKMAANEEANNELFRQSYIQDINNILNQIDPKNSLSKI